MQIIDRIELRIATSIDPCEARSKVETKVRAERGLKFIMSSEIDQ